MQQLRNFQSNSPAENCSKADRSLSVFVFVCIYVLCWYLYLHKIVAEQLVHCLYLYLSVCICVVSIFVFAQNRSRASRPLSSGSDLSRLNSLSCLLTLTLPYPPLYFFFVIVFVFVFVFIPVFVFAQSSSSPQFPQLCTRPFHFISSFLDFLQDKPSWKQAKEMLQTQRDKLQCSFTFEQQ